MLRVVSENLFDSYEGLSLAIREELHDLDFEAHGAFPIDLKGSTYTTPNIIATLGCGL
ncbi:hypothetical protein P4S81_06220 [Pseudoalteromonas sp. B28]